MFCRKENTLFLKGFRWNKSYWRIGLSTLQQDLIACRRYLLSQRASPWIWQGFWNVVWLQKQMEIEIIKLWVNSRSSHQRCSVRKNVLRNFSKFIAKFLRTLFYRTPPGDWFCNSDKIIAWLRTNIPWELKSRTASTSWQHRHSLSVFTVEHFYTCIKH